MDLSLGASACLRWRLWSDISPQTDSTCFTINIQTKIIPFPLMEEDLR